MANLSLQVITDTEQSPDALAENNSSDQSVNNDKITNEIEKIETSIKDKLSEEEEEKLKDDNSVNVITAPTGDYKGNVTLSDSEKNESIKLQESLVSFLDDKIQIVPNEGTIETLPTGIDLLDSILGGGFGCGTLTVIVGLPGTFKSALLGQVIGTSQKKFKGKLLASYLDSEEAMTEDRLYMLGTRNPRVKPYSNITVEQVFKTVEGHCLFKDVNNLEGIPSMVAWDSVANTPTEKDGTSDSLNSTIGLKARILSFALPKYISKMRKYNVSLIAINQLREKLEMNPMLHTPNDLRYLGDKTMPGGQALKYNAFHLLYLKIKQDLKFDQWGFGGVKLEVKCIKNKLFTPNIPVSLVVDFNKGVSNFWTNYSFLIETKRLTSAAWCSLKSYPQLKFRTKDALSKYNEDKQFREEFDKNVKDAIKTEIFDKYSNVPI